MLELVQLDVIKQEIEAYKRDVDEVIEYTKKLEVKTKKDAQLALNYIARARDLLDKIDEKKKELTRDSRDYVTKVNNIAKQLVEPLILVEDMIIMKIDHWKLENQGEIDKQKEQLEDLEEFGLEIIPLFDDSSKTESELASIFERIVFTYEIVDMNQIPQKYLKLDEDVVEKDIKQGIRNIPGLKIIKNKKTIIRRK